MSNRRGASASRVTIPPGLVEYTQRLVDAALAEDVGGGDITTRAVVDARQRGSAVMVAKEPFVLAGLFVAREVFRRIDPKVSFKASFSDGDRVRKGAVIAGLRGPMAALLAGERVALNFLQRLSGVATLTAGFVARTSGTGARILDTRKTTPCMRPLERYAVRAGGGLNHRFGLFDRVLIKDNHIKAAGGVLEAVRRARAAAPGATVEVEVTDQREIRQALEAGADIIMLDNMSVGRLSKAVAMIGGLAVTEASGGVRLDNVGAIARTGVDFISVGALTHSARAVDISMKVVFDGAGQKR